MPIFFIQKDLGLCGSNNVDWIKRVLGSIYFYLPKNCIPQQICILLQICRPNNVDWIKRVLGPIYFHLPKPFCQRTVFCGKAVFCGRFVFCSRFVFCCKLLLLALFSLEISCSSVFLVGLWALLLIGFSSS